MKTSCAFDMKHIYVTKRMFKINISKKKKKGENQWFSFEKRNTSQYQLSQ